MSQTLKRQPALPASPHLSPGAMIELLGGRAEVAAALGCDVTTVSHWVRRGIPARLHAAFVRLAKERRVRGITIDVLAAGWEAARPVGSSWPPLPRPATGKQQAHL